MINTTSAKISSYAYKVYGLMFLALLLSTCTSIITYKSGFLDLMLSNKVLKHSLSIISIGIILLITFMIKKMNYNLLLLSYFAYSIISGMFLSVLMIKYSSSNILSVLLVTSLMFGGVSIYGYLTKKDFSKYGGILILGLLGLILSIIINALIGSEIFGYIISIIGVILFLCATIYETSRIKINALIEDDKEREKESISDALSLYLSFVNIFLFLFRLTNSK